MVATLRVHTELPATGEWRARRTTRSVVTTGPEAHVAMNNCIIARRVVPASAEKATITPTILHRQTVVNWPSKESHTVLGMLNGESQRMLNK